MLLKDRQDFHKPYATHTPNPNLRRSSDSENTKSSLNNKENELLDRNTDTSHSEKEDSEVVAKIKHER